MRDEMDSRLWVEHGQGWSDLVGQVAAQVKLALRAIHAFEFDAPWRAKQKHGL